MRTPASYSTARYKVASVLAQDFKAWVSGQATGESGAPTKPLCASEREAVASVVLRYAAQNAALISSGSAQQVGGRNLIAYLQQQGVSCGSSCTLALSAQDAQIEARSAAATRAANNRTKTRGNECLAVDKATLKLVNDDQAGLKNPTNDTVAALNADIDALIRDLTALRSQATTAEQAQLRNEISVLGRMKGIGGAGMGNADAVAVSFGFGASPVKELPALIGQICQ